MTIDPTTCPHAQRGRVDGKTWCALHGAWTECGEGHWGEPPVVVLLDTTPKAMPCGGDGWWPR